jgi:purine-binding chemotaxis protein CheW
MSRECIIFEVEGQSFALDIGTIREIRDWSPLTRVPGLPSDVVGVTNDHGAILPVIDLSLRLGWNPIADSESHSIIIVQFDDHVCALVVEQVGDLVLIDENTLLPPPELGNTAPANTALRFIEGLAPYREGMVQLLDIAALTEDCVMQRLHSA